MIVVYTVAENLVVAGFVTWCYWIGVGIFWTWKGDFEKTIKHTSGLILSDWFELICSKNTKKIIVFNIKKILYNKN